MPESPSHPSTGWLTNWLRSGQDRSAPRTGDQFPSQETQTTPLSTQPPPQKHNKV